MEHNRWICHPSTLTLIKVSPKSGTNAAFERLHVTNKWTFLLFSVSFGLSCYRLRSHPIIYFCNKIFLCLIIDLIFEGRQCHISPPPPSGACDLNLKVQDIRIETHTWACGRVGGCRAHGVQLLITIVYKRSTVWQSWCSGWKSVGPFYHEMG